MEFDEAEGDGPEPEMGRFAEGSGVEERKQTSGIATVKPFSEGPVWR